LSENKKRRVSGIHIASSEELAEASTRLDIEDKISKIQAVFTSFHAFIRKKRWTISFVASQFDYSDTRMGEILKFKNVKNGKRKIPEWTKLKEKMIDIMNDQRQQEIFEEKFQHFQNQRCENLVWKQTIGKKF